MRIFTVRVKPRSEKLPKLSAAKRKAVRSPTLRSRERLKTSADCVK